MCALVSEMLRMDLSSSSILSKLTLFRLLSPEPHWNYRRQVTNVLYLPNSMVNSQSLSYLTKQQVYSVDQFTPLPWYTFLLSSRTPYFLVFILSYCTPSQSLLLVPFFLSLFCVGVPQGSILGHFLCICTHSLGDIISFHAFKQVYISSPPFLLSFIFKYLTA